MNIPVTVIGQKMILDTGQSVLAPGSQKFIKFVFDLSDEWNGLRIFAQWVQKGASYNKYLESDGSVYLPSEIIEGECTMTLYGTGSGNVIGTTLPLCLYIQDNHYVADINSTEITQPLFDQLMAELDGYLTEERIATHTEVQSYLGSDLIATNAEVQSYLDLDWIVSYAIATYAEVASYLGIS